MSYVKILVHVVFSTKLRMPLLDKDIREGVREHIILNCKEKEIFLQSINGYEEHLHALISLGKNQTIAKVVQLMKGESSYWINHRYPIDFAWQDDYFAVSVSQSHVDRVVRYIKNQEEHHSRKNYLEEIDEFVTRYGFQLIQDEKGK